MTGEPEASRAFPSAGFLLFVAGRTLLQSPFVAALLVLSVAAGVAFQIPNAANLLGYDAEIVDHGVTRGFGDVRVAPRRGSRFEDGDALAARLARRPGTVAAVPILTLPGALGRDGSFRGTLIMGVDPGSARPPFRLERGAPLASGEGRRLVAGDVIAGRLRAGIGDAVELRAILRTGGGLLDDVGRYSMTVGGIAQGSFVAPEGVVVDRSFLAGELGEPRAASLVLVHLADHAAAREEARRIEAELPDVLASAWMDDTPFLGHALEGSAAVGAISRTMVVLAVFIPVWALLHMRVLYRRRDVGLLGALGVGPSEVFLVFLLQALLVGLVGAAVGAVAGWGLVAWFEAHPIFRTGSFVIRPIVTVRTFLVPMLTVLAAALLGGVLPAWRAARLDPARILRGAE